jgi:hypothetical protein
MAMPAPSTSGGFCADRGPAREVTTSAPPPSEITQQSRRWSGEEMMRDASTSSTVIGSRYLAYGIQPAWRRIVTAISASCSLVVRTGACAAARPLRSAPTIVGP